MFTALVLSAPFAAHAASVTPTSYTYVVAPTSSTAYLDDTYNGTTGELTDGISATTDWQSTDGFGRTGPNVGWLSVNPTIQFNFDQVYEFTGLVMNFQDGQGAYGVGIPSAIIVNGVTSPTLTGGSTAGPLDTLMDLGALAPTDTLLVEVTRNASWTFLSEFTFETTTTAMPVPLPAGLPLLLAGLGGLMALRRRG